MDRAEPAGFSARRAAILDAAGAIFTETGFAVATTAAIASRARVSKRAIYDLFGSKQALLEAVISQSSAQMTDAVSLPPPQNAAMLLAVLDGFGRQFLERILSPSHLAMQRMVIAEAQTNAEIGRLLDENGRGAVIDAMGGFFRAAADKGLIAPADADLLPSAYLALLLGPLQMRALSSSLPDREAAISTRLSLSKRLVEHFLLP